MQNSSYFRILLFLLLFNCSAGQDTWDSKEIKLWTAKTSNQWILREINPGYSLEGLMLTLKLQYFGNTSKWQLLWFLISLWGTHLIELFNLSNLFQMSNDSSVVNVEFFGKFLCSLRSNPMIFSVGCCQLSMAGHYVPHCQGSWFLCETYWITTALYFVSSS